MQSLVAAIPALFSVALMAMFVFLVFGVVGIQLWSGVMKGECDKPGSGIPCALDCSGPLCQSTYGDACPAGYVSAGCVRWLCPLGVSAGGLCAFLE